jgi:hypothetical protein
MDTLAHGLWGSAAFGQRERKDFWPAFFLGMGPDLFSFGPFFLMWALHGFSPMHRAPAGHPDPSAIPHYVYAAYNVTHSLVVWGAVGALLWLARKRAPWVWGAWALHILCDIPTHSIRFFPTPFLWPFATPFVDGVPWANRWFMAANYAAIVTAFLLLRARRKRRAG